MQLCRSAHGFELKLQSLTQLRVGSNAADKHCFPEAPTLPDPSPVPLTCNSKGAFLDGLQQLWSQAATPLLAPNPRHLPQNNSVQTEVAGLKSFGAFDRTTTKPTVAFRGLFPLIEVLTSGSTGTPQRYRKTAEQILGEALLWVDFLTLTEADTVLATTAFHHIYGLLLGVLAPWAANSKIVTDAGNEAGAFHPERIAELACSHGATLLVTVPAHLRALGHARPPLGQVKRVICSAAPLSSAEARRFEDAVGIEVIDILGSTETGGIATRRPALATAWRPLPGVAIRIAKGAELEIRSPFSPTSEDFTKTGETATLCPDGCFEYLGRSDGVLKVGGKRVHLNEIEELARRLPGVCDALALSQPVTSLRGQEIFLVVQGNDLEAQQIKLALANVLDPIFVPRRIRIVEKFPRDERGKISREVAHSLFRRGRLS